MPLNAGNGVLKLPEELILCIMSYLSPVDLCALAQTCTIFSILSKDEWLWKMITERDFGVTVKEELCSWMSSYIQLYCNVENIKKWVKPLHHACEMNMVPVVAHLISLGYDVNELDKYGLACVHYAARNGLDELTRILIKEFGVDVHLPNSVGNTPLHDACSFGKSNVVSILIKLGADVNAKDMHGETPLHEASRTNQIQCAKTLIADANGRVNINSCNQDNNTALHVGCMKGSLAVCEFLLEIGADRNVINHHGKTAYDVIGWGFRVHLTDEHRHRFDEIFCQ